MYKQCSILLIVTALIMFSIIGCSKKDIAVSDNNVSDNTVSINDVVEEPIVPPIEFELYDEEVISVLGNMNILHVDTVDLTPNEEKTSAIMYTGMLSLDEFSYESENLIFYVFSNEEEASRAYEYIKQYNLQSSYIENNNSVTGYDAQAIDISIKHFYFLNRNMIVYHLDYLGDPGSISTEPEGTHRKNTLLHEQIMTLWNY